MTNTEHTPQKTHTFFNDEGKAFAYLVIDSEVDGRACGGIRMAPDLSVDELAALAREMSLKFAFLGIDLGGAKSGIIGDPEADAVRKGELLESFGKSIAPWLKTGTYIPGGDLGTSDRDVQIVLSAAGVSKMTQVQPRDTSSGEATALTVFTAMEVACETTGFSLSSARIGIEGFGSVGSALGKMVARRGAKVVAISTSRGSVFDPNGIEISLMTDLQRFVGSECVKEYKGGSFSESRSLATLPIDIYAPCARTHSISQGNVQRVNARLVCGGSNLQALPGVERTLHERSIFYVPPYVANCGGVFWGALQVFGLDFSYFQDIVKTRFQARVSRLFEEAIRKNKTPLEIADDVVTRKFQTLKAGAEGRGPRQFIWRLGRAANNRGFVPLSVKRAIGKRQVSRWLSD
jgi:glutamate dehydrogenase/leucine dehydrogenase